MFYAVVTKMSLSAKAEEQDDFQDLKVLFEGDDEDSVEGFIMTLIDNRDSEIYSWKHVKILSDDGYELKYWFQYAWLPKSAWIRLNPPPEEIKELVPTKGRIYRPNMHKAIKEYVKSQQV